MPRALLAALHLNFMSAPSQPLQLGSARVIKRVARSSVWCDGIWASCRNHVVLRSSSNPAGATAAPARLGSSGSSTTPTPTTSETLEQAQHIMWGQRSLAERFGTLSGRELQDRIFKVYQARQQQQHALATLCINSIILNIFKQVVCDCPMSVMPQVSEAQQGGLSHVDWFSKIDQSQNIVRHPLNGRKQTSIRARYRQSILSYGVMVGCRGEAWLVAHLARVGHALGASKQYQLCHVHVECAGPLDLVNLTWL